jgi:hypothetical protein
MLEIILYLLGFYVCTVVLQGILHKVRKNHNQGASAIWVGTGAIMVICVLGLVMRNINYLAGVLGFVMGDETGRIAGWHG